MKYRRLGHSGVEVSRLVLGTMNFGPVTSEKESFDLLDSAVEMGINFIDTANIYGWAPNQGWTEEIIGRWLTSRRGMREQLVIGTKVFGSMGEGPNERGLSAFHLRRQIDACLRRLQVEHIDLLQFHHIDRSVRWEEIWQAIDLMASQGKITYAGSSNFAGWQIAQATEIAARNGRLGLVSEQSLYNLAERTVELEVLPAASNYGLGVLAWSPLHGGLLAGNRLKTGSQRRQTPEADALRLKLKDGLARFDAICAETGHHPAKLALAWLLQKPAVTAAVVGPRTISQLKNLEHQCEIELENSLIVELEACFPGPNGPAPESYAW